MQNSWGYVESSTSVHALKIVGNLDDNCESMEVGGKGNKTKIKHMGSDCCISYKWWRKMTFRI